MMDRLRLEVANVLNVNVRGISLYATLTISIPDVEKEVNLKLTLHFFSLLTSVHNPPIPRRVLPSHHLITHETVSYIALLFLFSQILARFSVCHPRMIQREGERFLPRCL